VKGKAGKERKREREFLSIFLERERERGWDLWAKGPGRKGK